MNIWAIRRAQLLAILSFTTLALVSTAQEASRDYLQGYTESISGKQFGYHSPVPSVDRSLLLRGQSDFDPLEWKGQAVPDDYSGEQVSYIWLFGMDVTSAPVDFQLSVNGIPIVAFESSRTSDLGVRTIQGEQGSELVLNTTMLDKYEDQMGFAILTLPVEVIGRGQAPVFRLSTTTKENPSWFMTFQSSVEESIEIYQNKVVAQDGDALMHSISIDLVHIGDPASVNIQIGDIDTQSVLKQGFNKMEIYLPKAEEETEYTARISIDGRSSSEQMFTIQPVREWEIFLVQHTHTDIGYTRPQTEILQEHLRYIDHALDYCDLTDAYPDDAKFRWTCETSWSVREYLESRPQAQIDRLIERIKEGRIEATGMFLNYSEIIDEAALAAQTKYLQALKNMGIDVTTAMQNDVNGIAWCLVDYFSDTDVKYLTMGIHAHRARKPFNKPTSFWWQSPAGNRLLAYRSEHYMHGNTLGVTGSQQDNLRNNLSSYLTELEDKGYPYDKVSLQFSGYVTDNSPPSTKVCDIIKAWNEKYAWPKLRSALAKDFMVYLDEQHADDIPQKKVAWPDWWTDGVASAANETKVVRNTHVQASSIGTLMSMGKLLGADTPPDFQRDLDEVYDNLLFYDEHTHGAAESVRDPLVQNSINQWGMKAAYAWDAAKRASALEEKVLAFIEPRLPRSSMPTIAVFNTLNWTRSGIVSLFIENEIVPEGEYFSITDGAGTSLPYQLIDQRQEGAYFVLWVNDIPAMGFKTLKIDRGPQPNKEATTTSGLLENQYYKIEVDDTDGTVSQIYDNELGVTLFDGNDSVSIGQFIYEQLDNRHELERLTNTNRDTTYKPLSGSRNVMQDVEIVGNNNGAIYQSLFLRGSMPICADPRGINIEIRLHHHQKKIEFLYSMIKLPVTDPEAVYIAFPFNLDNGHLAYEAQGGVVRPGINQLEGTSSDWNAIQNFASVRNNDNQIVLVSPEIPLVQFGAINTGRYYYRLNPQSNHIYSWVLNNYWVTNFKASQEGELQWRYSITSSSDNSDMMATRFGWNERTPFKSRIILPKHNADNTVLTSRSLIDIDVPNLLLVNASPASDSKGIVLHLREVEGEHADLNIQQLLNDTAAKSAERVSVLEEPLELLTTSLSIDHYETVFLRLNLDD